MTPAQRLLSIAGALCGDAAVQRVFEPLVADWSAEWRRARGARRLRCAVAGSAAYLWSVLRCFDLAAWFSSQPHIGFTAIVLFFATAGAVASMQPLHYTWIGFGVRFRWLAPAPSAIYFVPNIVAHYAGFALLPALLLAVLARAPWRRIAMLFTATLAAMLIVDGWVHPTLMRARSTVAADLLRPGRSPAQDIRIYTTTSELLTRAANAAPQLSEPARAALWDKVYLLIAPSWSCALLGAALGACGRRRAWRFTLGRLAALWIASTLGFWIVAEWAWAVEILLELPAPANFWLPSAVFVLAGGAVAILAVRAPQRPEASA